MNRILEKRDFLSISEAARYLSSAFNEPVSKSDVFRLALSGELTLFVEFVNGATARPCKEIPPGEARWGLTAKDRPFCRDNAVIKKWREITSEEKNNYCLTCFEIELDDDRFYKAGEITPIEGFWELPMIGSEEIEVECQYRDLEDEPRPSIISNLKGIFIQDETGELYQLQAYGSNSYCDTEEEQGYFPALRFDKSTAYTVRKEILDNYIAAEKQITPKEEVPDATEQTKATAYLSKLKRQELRILEILKSPLGHNPKALPEHKKGMPRLKSEVRKVAMAETDLFTASAFNKAWQRLLDQGDIIIYGAGSSTQKVEI